MGKHWLTKADVHGPPEEMMDTSAATSQDTSSSLNNEVQQIEKPQKAILRSPRSFCSSIHLSSPSELSINACCATLAQVKVPTTKTMGISKSNRIIILLVIDSAFFLLELVVGKELYPSLYAGFMLTRISRLCRPFTRPRCRLISYGSFLAYKYIW